MLECWCAFLWRGNKALHHPTKQQKPSVQEVVKNARAGHVDGILTVESWENIKGVQRVCVQSPLFRQMSLLK